MCDNNSNFDLFRLENIYYSVPPKLLSRNYTYSIFETNTLKLHNTELIWNYTSI